MIWSGSNYEPKKSLWKLFVLDKNIWNLITMCKQMFIIK